jgi:hypothetical protein
MALSVYIEFLLGYRPVLTCFGSHSVISVYRSECDTLPRYRTVSISSFFLLVNVIHYLDTDQSFHSESESLLGYRPVWKNTKYRTTPTSTMSLSSDPELYFAWTIVSKKRGRPPQEDNTREAKHSREDSYWLNPTSTSNRYSALSDEDSSEHHQKSNIETTPKSPPIFVSNVTTVSTLIHI